MKKFLLMSYLQLFFVNVYSIGFLTEIYLNYNGSIQPIPDPCLKILEAFAGHASNFTLCSIIYSRPIKICENCIDNYINFKQKYEELKHAIINGTSCGSLFMSQDRLNIVQQQHDSILAVWNKGHCNTCFDWVKEVPTLKNDTIRFMKMYDDTMFCIRTNRNRDNDKVCEECMITYNQLDDFYRSLSTDSIGVDSVCMDIVDSMNSTRSIWSKTLKCCSLRRSPEILFLCCAGIISSLPLLFYLTLRFCGPIRDLPNALKQTRFKQSFLRNINNRNE